MNFLKLTDRIAIVTGAGIGMGRGIALKLAQEGAAVLVSDKDPNTAAQTARDIEAAGGKAIAVTADISKLGDIEAMFDTCEDQLGAPDILVANAGISRRAAITEVTEELFDTVYNVNAKGTMFCLKQAGLRLKDGGRVVAMSSCSAKLAEEGMAVYSSTKAAIQMMVEVAAQEFATRGITVNSVQPGLTETPTMLAHAPDFLRQHTISRTPLKRLGTPEDIADVVAFLVSDDARWVTGQHILVNGGGVSIY